MAEQIAPVLRRGYWGTHIVDGGPDTFHYSELAAELKATSSEVRLGLCLAPLLGTQQERAIGGTNQPDIGAIPRDAHLSSGICDCG